ncbi:esterase/lipase family protein [Streptomyces sp. NPDC102437]|uniref:esterase/lipase family protein n=1 Tax=Streptomyces sp. NPDC102437 TaxID=3366175 RepID=UPI00380F3FA9
MRRIVMIVLLALVSGFLMAGPAVAAPARTDTGRNPVIFVHGRNAGPGVWDRMITDFESGGYSRDRLFAWSYDTTQSTNEVLADRLGSYVDEVLRTTGAQQVDLVAHSLGGLPTRWYVAFGGGRQKVARWVSLAGPNHGTSVAYLCALWDQGCRDMTPGSYVLSRLNGDDETPGSVQYSTFWSACDEQITPTSSTALSGAVNVRTDCLKHNDLLTNSAVSSGVREALAG